jgi:di/tricarboxylate transporter
MQEKWQKELVEKQEQIRGHLVQIKLLLVVILLLLLAPILGPVPLLQLFLIGLIGLATIYLGLRTFDWLVKRNVGQDWGEARLASFLDDTDNPDSDDSREPR